MPTYEYQCQECGHEWETVQSMKDDALKDCPKCSKASAKRLISKGTGFIMKEGGAGSTISAATPPAAMSDNERSFRDRFEQVSGIKTTDE